MSGRHGGGVLRRGSVVGIGNAGVAHADFFTTAECWVAIRSKGRQAVLVVARQIDHPV